MSDELLKKSDLRQFVEFNTRVYPNRKGIEESIKFKLQHPLNDETVDNHPVIVVKDSQGCIIGQFQRVPCKFLYKNEIRSAYWGMDYIVDPAHRGGSAGVFLAKRALKDPHFGIGLSPISFKMHLIFGEKLLGYCEKRLWIRSVYHACRFALSVVLQKSSTYMKEDPVYPDQIKLGKETFIKTTNLSQVKWVSSNSGRIEFIRDEQFLKWRFGRYPQVFAVYTMQDKDRTLAFFVVRKVFFKGFPFLLLVDYRYSDNCIFNILRAAKKLVKRSACIGIISLSSINEVDKALRASNFIKFGQKGQIVSNVEYPDQDKIEERKAIMVTFADSDADMFYGNKEWYE